MATTKNQIQSRNISIPALSQIGEADADALSSLTLNIRLYKSTAANKSATTVLFLPFWGGSAETYDAVLGKLAARRPSNISVALSYRGTGSSKIPVSNQELDLPSHHSIPSLAADVLALLHHKEVLDDLIPSHKLVIVAHSMSAKVTLEVLRRLSSSTSTDHHSDQINLKVASVLLLAPAPPGPLELPPEVRQQQLTAYDTIESARWTVKNVLTYKSLDPDTLEKAARDCVQLSPGAKRGWIEQGMKVSCLDAVGRITERTILEKEAKEGHGPKPPPVRVLVGRQDMVETVERVQSETVDILENFGVEISLRVLEGVGHLIPLEDPDTVVEEVQNLLSNISV